MAPPHLLSKEDLMCLPEHRGDFRRFQETGGYSRRAIQDHRRSAGQSAGPIPAPRVNVSLTQTIRNRLLEGGSTEVGSVLTAQHCGARPVFAREHQNWQFPHWRPQTRAGSPSAPVIDVRDSGEDKKYIMLPVTLFNVPGLVGGQ